MAAPNANLESDFLDLLGVGAKPNQPIDLLDVGTNSNQPKQGQQPPASVDLLDFDDTKPKPTPPERSAAEELMALVEATPKTCALHAEAQPAACKVDVEPSQPAPAGLQGTPVPAAGADNFEGKWVPTYMRRQLAENGHSALPPPSAPNAHEHKVGARPPCLSDAFSEMGEEISQMAQSTFGFLSGALSGNFDAGAGGGNMPEEDGSENLLCPFPDATAAGLGPVRSQLTEHLHGIDFSALLDAAIAQSAAKDFEGIITSRSRVRQSANYDGSLQGWLFSTELSTAVLPFDMVNQFCSVSLRCRERWYIERGSQRASLELSTRGVSDGPIIAALRVDIFGQPQGCIVDNRLYATPRTDIEAVLPPGLIERLIVSHKMQSENLRRIVSAVVPRPAIQSVQPSWQMPSDPNPQIAPQSYQAPSAGINSSISPPMQAGVSSGYGQTALAAPMACPPPAGAKKFGVGADDPFAELTAELMTKGPDTSGNQTTI